MRFGEATGEPDRNIPAVRDAAVCDLTPALSI